ncbi:MAG: FIST N-terminal domain-containing protein [Acidimicrobiia bacterium]
MELDTLSWGMDAGWSAPIPEHLDSESTLVLAFGDPAIGADPRPIKDLRAALPTARLLGCSTAGQILGDELTDRTLVVSIARFDQTRVEATTAAVDGPSASYAAGQGVAAALSAPDLRAVFVLSDGLLVNGSELVRGCASGLAPDVIVTGGLAGDGERFERTWVLANDEPVAGAIAAVGLYGDAVQVGAGSFGGWDIFGPERRITRSDGNVLFELDGRPALELYKEYLGDRASGLPATALLFPLAVREARDATRRTVRTILAVDEAAQSMTFAGDVPQGWCAQLMRANKDRLVDGAMQAAVMSDLPASDGPQLAVAISCVGRRLVLGERTEEEIEATLEALAPTASLVGFYSYGEIAPHAEGSCDLHNQTMTITTVSEA